MTRAKIVGMGAYAPKRVLSNADLEAMVETSDEWIVQRTGIRERRIAEEGEATVLWNAAFPDGRLLHAVAGYRGADTSRHLVILQCHRRARDPVAA